MENRKEMRIGMAENQELLFAKILGQVTKTAKEQGGCIGQEQVEEAFAELVLSKEQLEMVFDYLKKHKIGVGEPVNLDEYLSREETDYLEEYKKQLEGLEELTKGQKEAVTLSAMAGEREAQTRLIQAYLKEVVEISKLYSGQGVFLEDLIGEGNVALSLGVTMLGCLENAEEAEGMLIKMVMDAMEESIARSVQEADTDKKVADKVNKVAKKAKELSGELQRKVTKEELSEETGMSLKTIEDAIRMSGYAIEDIVCEEKTK